MKDSVVAAIIGVMIGLSALCYFIGHSHGFEAGTEKQKDFIKVRDESMNEAIYRCDNRLQSIYFDEEGKLQSFSCDFPLDLD